MKKINLIIRTCAVVHSVGKDKRPFELNKEILILKCLKSILNNCKGFEKRIFIDLVDDSSPKKFISKIKNLLSKYKIKSVVHELDYRNNGHSLEFSYNLALKSKAELIYFCEDDYFHLNDSLASILDVYDSKILFTQEFALFPFDYPRLYQLISPSLIFVGKYNYWRSTDKTTGSFVIPKRLFKRYKSYFFALADFNKKDRGGERQTINHLWKKFIPCISPMPSLTIHLHKDVFPYFIDVKKELDKIKI